jgi:hypothetical protein
MLMIGNKKAALFPLPVSACPLTSRPIKNQISQVKYVKIYVLGLTIHDHWNAKRLNFAWKDVLRTRNIIHQFFVETSMFPYT